MCTLVDHDDRKLQAAYFLRGVIYGSFMTCELAEKCYNWLQRKHGNDAYPLFLGLMFDGAAANTSQTRTQTPLAFVILNAIKEDFKTHLLGYMPIHSSYSDEELKSMLEKKGCSIGVR